MCAVCIVSNHIARARSLFAFALAFFFYYFFRVWNSINLAASSGSGRHFWMKLCCDKLTIKKIKKKKKQENEIGHEHCEFIINCRYIHVHVQINRILSGHTDVQFIARAPVWQCFGQFHSILYPYVHMCYRKIFCVEKTSAVSIYKLLVTSAHERDSALCIEYIVNFVDFRRWCHNLCHRLWVFRFSVFIFSSLRSAMSGQHKT